MELIKPGTTINFVGYMKVAVALSLTVITVSLVGLFVWPGPRWGIDFAGGAELEVSLKQHLDEAGIAKLRAGLKSLNLGEVKVQEWIQMGEGTTNKYTIRMGSLGFEEGEQGDKESPVKAKLAELYGPDGFEILKTDYVGPRVGADLRNKGFLAIGYAMALILIYVTLRFEFRYAVGAVLALFHDVSITTGAFVWTHKDVNLTTIAALLTIVGYSLNDTIVVFDRIRENARRMRKLSFNEMINTSINETLSRTILTAFTTAIVVFFLWLLGGGVIHDFAFAMLVGLIVGTYSSIYVASAFVIWWENIRAARRSPAEAEGK